MENYTHEMSIIIPASLTKEHILTFQTLYFEQYQEKINFQEAKEKGLQVAQFIAAVLQLEIEVDNQDCNN